MTDNSSNYPDSDATLIPMSMTGVWKAEPSQSSIAFTVSQMFIGKLLGRFTDFDVTINARENPLESSVTAAISLDSVSTGNARRDHHVRSAGYFNAEEYPVAEYRSTGIVSERDKWIIEGELTLRGVTRPLQLTVASRGMIKELPDTRQAKFTATGEFSRRDFDISTGIPTVGDRVSLSIELEAVHQI